MHLFLNTLSHDARVLLVCAALACGLPLTAYADAGLIVETPTGLLGFLSNVGHVSVWVSHGCLDASGQILYCEHSAGLVFTSTAYWPNPGAAAIPADLFLLGSHTGINGRSAAAWNATMAETYPDVESATGAKYMGRAWLRSLRVVKFVTTPEEDRRVLEKINEVQRSYRYSYSHRNCAFYAQSILRLYFGGDFRANRTLELGIDTPRALERALQHRLYQEAVPNQVITFRGRLRHVWRQPPRNICESAIFDPKYAIPLLVYQPYLYVGFAGCYAAIRITSVSKQHHPAQFTMSLVQRPALVGEASQFHSFAVLTGEESMLAQSDRKEVATSLPRLNVQTTTVLPEGSNDF